MFVVCKVGVTCVTPIIFECVFISSVVLSICRCSLVLYSSWSDVNTVQVVLSGLSMRLSLVHACACCRYAMCRCKCL